MLKNKLYVYGEGQLEVPAHLNFGQEILDIMMRNKDIDALLNADTNEIITYGELAQQTVDIALSLARMGVGKGDVVSICSEKHFGFMATALGVMCAGATFSPCDITSGTRTLLYRVNIAKPKVMFCSSTAYKTHINAFRTADSIESYIVFGDEAQPGAVLFKHFLTEHARVEDFQPVPVDGLDDSLLILMSSGTTGLPKGIRITHLGAIICFRNLAIDGIPGKKILNSQEWCYTYGLMYILACLNQASTVVYCQEYSIENFLGAIQKYKIQRIQLTPFSLNELVKSPIIHNYDTSTLELIVAASTTLMTEAVIAVKKICPGLHQIAQLYGISEVGVICTDLRVPNGTKPGSVGVTFPGFIIKVVDMETREPLGPNQRGEICLTTTSPTLISKYMGVGHEDPKDEEGFFKTGDLGYYDDDNCFYILDRIKEIIKYNDFTLVPAEFEALLEQHPSVLEAGVVGVPHERHGEVPVAFVALRPGATATEQDLINHVNSQVTHRISLAGGVRFVSSLPRGAGNKLDRKALKQMLIN